MPEITLGSLIRLFIFFVGPANLILIFSIKPLIRSWFTGVFSLPSGFIFGYGGITVDIRKEFWRFILGQALYIVMDTSIAIMDLVYIDAWSDYLGAL